MQKRYNRKDRGNYFKIGNAGITLVLCPLDPVAGNTTWKIMEINESKDKEYR